MTDEMDPRIMALNAVLKWVPPKSMEFCTSLVKQYLEKKRLSERQWYWVGKLTEEATERGEMKKAEETPLKEDEFDYSPIVKLFDTAGEKIGARHIRLQTKQGTKVQLTPAYPDSSYAGKILVRVRPQDYMARILAGTIDKVGHLQLNSSVAVLGLIDLLKELANAPAETAAKYGRETGTCCFCGLGLTDPRSVTVGYGPICAGNYGLPWGDFVNKADMAEAAVLEKEIFQETEH